MCNAQFEVTENFVWHEFCLAYCYNKKIRAYIDRRKKFNRWSNWAIIIISTSSAISYGQNDALGAILACIVAVAMIVKELLPIFNQDESELLKLSQAATFYAEYQVEMEQLYVALKYNHQHPIFCQEAFFKLKGKAAKYLTVTNEYFRGLPKRIDKRIQNELDNYVREIYN